MEVIAPLPCTEASGRELLRMCDRWTTRYFFKSPVLLLDPKLPADILSDDNHETSTVDITNWEERYSMNWDSNSIDGWAFNDNESKFTSMPLSVRGVDNYIGSQVLHVEEHLSIIDQVLQMLLLASCDLAMSIFRKNECTTRYHEPMLPEGELGMDKKSFSSPIAKQAPAVYTKMDAPGDGSSSPITRQAPEVYTKMDAPGDGASSPISKQAAEVYAKMDAPEDKGDSFVQESRDLIGVTTAADSQHRNGRNVECNQIVKQSKTCSGGSGSKPDDDIDNMQQQLQQQQHHVDSFDTGVHLCQSDVAPAHSVVNEDCVQACHSETIIAPMNCMNISGSMNCNNNSGCMTVSGMVLNEQRLIENSYQTAHRTDGAPVINFTEQKGQPELDSSSVMAEDNISKALKNAPAAAMATTWIVASAAPHHATGNHALLSDFTPEHRDIFLFAGDAGAMPMQVVGRGVVITDTMLLSDVWYVPGLVANLVSVSQLAELDYSVAFGRGKCYVRSTVDGTIVGAADAGEDGLFALDFLRVPLGQ